MNLYLQGSTGLDVQFRLLEREARGGVANVNSLCTPQASTLHLHLHKYFLLFNVKRCENIVYSSFWLFCSMGPVASASACSCSCACSILHAHQPPVAHRAVCWCSTSTRTCRRRWIAATDTTASRSSGARCTTSVGVSAFSATSSDTPPYDLTRASQSTADYSACYCSCAICLVERFHKDLISICSGPARLSTKRKV